MALRARSLGAVERRLRDSLFNPPAEAGVSSAVAVVGVLPNLREKVRFWVLAGRFGLGEIVSSFATLFLPAVTFALLGAACFPCLPFFAPPADTAVSVAGVGGWEALSLSLKPPPLPVLADAGAALLLSGEVALPVLSLSFIDMMKSARGRLLIPRHEEDSPGWLISRSEESNGGIRTEYRDGGDVAVSRVGGEWNVRLSCGTLR